MKTGQKLQRRRQFSDEFKLGVVSEYESGAHTVAELSRLIGSTFKAFIVGFINIRPTKKRDMLW